MQELNPIERPKQVSEVVLERLRHDIVTGAFELGEKISEGQVATAYGVTKAPVRAAYTRLQGEGLLEIRPQSGTYVFKPTKEDLRALCELRIALELEAVRLSLDRNAQALEDALSKIYSEMESALEESNQMRYQILDTELHLVFFTCSGSPYLEETFRVRVSSAFAALRYRFAKNSAHNAASIGEHRQLLDRVIARDLAGLRKVLRAHIENTESYYELLLNSR